ncbi:hypothetical protein KRP22_007537 [Phytophthora ramorum]|nr:hypothetical protein KRP22_4452 [Phytophthora ramorum]
MGSRKITRCRGARGQLALYNPQMVPSEVAQELEGIYGFRPQGATGCLAGSIAAIAQAGAEKLLDVTVLSTAAAHAIEEFFKTEYAVD